MQISDCVVLATKKRTLGLYLLKLWNGVCVLGSNSGGPLEIIDDEKLDFYLKVWIVIVYMKNYFDYSK